MAAESICSWSSSSDDYTVNELYQERENTRLVKEIAETVIFTCFSRKEWLLFFNNSVLHLIAFPLLAVALTYEAYLDFHLCKIKRDIGSCLNFMAGLIIAGLVDTVVIATLVKGSFALGPYLFLGVLGAMLFKVSLQLFFNVKAYFREIDSDDKKAAAQEVVRSVIGIVGVAVVAVFIVGVMISPMGPLVTLGLGSAAALFTLSQVIWKLTPRVAKHKIKSCFSFFAKSDYSSLDKIEVASLPSQTSRPPC